MFAVRKQKDAKEGVKKLVGLSKCLHVIVLYKFKTSIRFKSMRLRKDIRKCSFFSGIEFNNK